MVVASVKIILDFYGNQNLKKKRDELGNLFKEIKKRFNVSVSEVDDFEDYERCVFGVCLIADSEAAGRSSLKKILDHIDGHSFARVVMEDSEIFHHEG